MASSLHKSNSICFFSDARRACFLHVRMDPTICSSDSAPHAKLQSIVSVSLFSPHLISFHLKQSLLEAEIWQEEEGEEREEKERERAKDVI